MPPEIIPSSHENSIPSRIDGVTIQLPLRTQRPCAWPVQDCQRKAEAFSLSHTLRKKPQLKRSSQNISHELVREETPPGALPTTTLPTPLYTPVRPPARLNPCEDWRRVFKVSMGKKSKSTEVPAAAPACRWVLVNSQLKAQKKQTRRDWIKVGLKSADILNLGLNLDGKNRHVTDLVTDYT